MKHIRRFRRMAALGMTAALLTGCWDRSELNDLALVMAAGFDQAESGRILLSAQIYVPKAGGSGQDRSKGSAQGQTMVKTVEGETLADAIGNLQMQLSREIFWGHGEVFIFGEERARNGIEKDLNLLLHARQLRERANIYVSKGKAAEILRLAPRLERDSAESLREMSRLNKVPDVTMVKLLSMLSGAESTAVLPYIQVRRSQPGTPSNQTSPYFVGSAVLKEGRLVGLLDIQATRGLLWLKNENKDAIFTSDIAGSKGKVSMWIINHHTTLVPSIREGKWSVDAYIESKSNLLQSTSGGDVMDPEWIRRAEMGASEEIENSVRSALEKAQKTYRSDIFGFGELFRRHYPSQWRAVQKNWNDVFSGIDVRVHVRTRLKRPGVTNDSIPY